MAKPIVHLRHQGPVIASMGRTVWAALGQRFRVNGQGVTVPSAELHAQVPPRDRLMVRDFVRYLGGYPDRYGTHLPPHLFPQWGVPIAASTLEGIPYPLVKILNGGCRLEMNSPLPNDEPLHVRARLESIDDDGRRAVLHQRIVTETASAPDALVAHVTAIVPLASAKGGRGKKKEPVRVPVDARQLVRWRLGADAGLHFAMLTGDFNPVHWIRPYAKAFGFRGKILHGFATMARVFEALVGVELDGDWERLATLDVRFTRPLVLPASVGLFVKQSAVYVGDGAGEPAYLVGEMTTRS